MHMYSHTVLPTTATHRWLYHLHVQPPLLLHMTTTTYNHHHYIKIQQPPPPPPPPHSAICNVRLFVCVHISKWASAPSKITTSASCSWWWRPRLQMEYFASWWKEKHHQHMLHSVKTILATSIGVGWRNQTRNDPSPSWNSRCPLHQLQDWECTLSDWILCCGVSPCR